MKDILLIEDNIELATLIQAFLIKKGFSFHHVISGEEAKNWLTYHQARLILLDIMLPGLDGFAICQHIRHTSEIPILIMSARHTKEDKLLGFELGADDYLEKPIDVDILVAKINALFNRTTSKHILLISGEIKIDQKARKVYLKNNLLDLNHKEYELLLLLVKNSGKTLQKEYLFNQIWGSNSESEFQTLTVHIKMLRSKIEDDVQHAKRIQTVWGVGYRYEEV